MNLMGIEVLHITIPNLGLNSIGVKNKRKYNILDSVHVNAPKGESETYINYSSFQYKLMENSISLLNIVIFDQDFNIINFNNIDWYINIVFAFTYINDLVIPKTLKDVQIENDTRTMKELLIEEESRLLYENAQ
jgi:hypothetical protein